MRNKRLIFINFLHQSPLFHAPLDRFFSSYLMFSMLVNLLDHQRQHELPQTQDLLVCLINFSHQSPLFHAPLDQYFYSYLMFRILVNLVGHQIQHELPQTQGLLVYLS